MDFARINKDKIIKMYVEEGKSSYEIAEELKTYSTRVLRALDFLGVERRTYSQAQANSLQSGRTTHPTKGKKLDEEHRRKIGESKSKSWHDLPQKEKDRISGLSKAAWDKKSDSEKYEMRRMALEAVREASKLGSKTERHLKNGLTKAGYSVMFHKTNLVPGSKLEVDMFLPEVKTAIEIDGPGHFLPIWGEDKMRKQQSADTIKQGILISHGYVVLRIRQVDKSISMTKMNSLLKTILFELDKVKTNFPSKNERLIEIEVSNGETKRI